MRHKSWLITEVSCCCFTGTKRERWNSCNCNSFLICESLEYRLFNSMNTKSIARTLIKITICSHSIFQICDMPPKSPSSLSLYLKSSTASGQISTFDSLDLVETWLSSQLRQTNVLIWMTYIWKDTKTSLRCSFVEKDKCWNDLKMYHLVRVQMWNQNLGLSRRTCQV